MLNRHIRHKRLKIKFRGENYGVYDENYTEWNKRQIGS
jgi:hypothetical protein